VDSTAGVHRVCATTSAQRGVDSAIRLFSTIFGEQTDNIKQQLLGHFLSIIEKCTASASSGSLSNVIANISAVMLATAHEHVAQRRTVDAKTADAFLDMGKQLLSCANPEVVRLCCWV
jgi:hypothetical protein